jgi:hypothetical protein
MTDALSVVLLLLAIGNLCVAGVMAWTARRGYLAAKARTDRIVEQIGPGR